MRVCPRLWLLLALLVLGGLVELLLPALFVRALEFYALDLLLNALIVVALALGSAVPLVVALALTWVLW